MDEDVRPEDGRGAELDEPAGGFTRRALLAGIGGAAAAGTTAWAGACVGYDLAVTYESSRRDVVLVTLTKVIAERQADGSEKRTVESVGRPLRWTARQFGTEAPFKISRESVVEQDEDRKETGAEAEEDEKKKSARWVPLKWILDVEGATFPGGRIGDVKGTHRLRFVFERRKGAFCWRMRLETERWPIGGRTTWGQGNGSSPQPVEVEAFLTGGGTEARLGRSLPLQVAQAVLADWFGDRIEAGADTRFELDRELNWYVSNPERKPELHVLLFPLSFSHLLVRRSYGASETSPVIGGGSSGESEGGAKAAASSAGLLGTIGGTVTLPPGERNERRFELGHLGDGSDRLTAGLVLYEIGHPTWSGDEVELKRTGGLRLAGALRQDGEPRHTLASLTIGHPPPEPDGDTAAAKRPASEPPRLPPMGRLEFMRGDRRSPAEIFDFSALRIERRLERQGEHGGHELSGKHVLTRTQLTPSDKERIVRTAFGPIEVKGLPAVAERPGLAAQVPPIVVETHDAAPGMRDRRDAVPRKLTRFEARLGLVSVAVRLPARIPDSRKVEPGPDEHTSRLDFADAECRFTMPFVNRPAAAAVDADIPIGPLAGGEDRRALLDLARARLTVLRPSDLLSLKFRFSGLLLDLPLPGPGQSPARIVPSRGALCRPGGPAMGEAGRRVPKPEDGKAIPEKAASAEVFPTRDERPVLVVEFPPQHVAERAYFGQRSLPDLPDPRFDLLFLPKAERDKRLPPVPGKPLSDLIAWFDGRPDEERSTWTKALAGLREPKRRRGGTEQDPGTTYADRKKYRETIRGLLNEAKWKPKFRDAFASQGLSLPAEQRIYVSPEFLDPAGRRLAYEVKKAIPDEDEGLPQDIGSPPDIALTQETDGLIIPPGFDATIKDNFEQSNVFESAKERKSGDYRDFRRLFARKAMLAKTEGGPDIPDQYRGRAWFAAVKGTLPRDLVAWVEAYEPEGEHNESFEGLVTPSRLSGPSRLAFRINCDDFQPERAGGGFDFSLEALTNWGSMDLAVVRRAERLFLAPGRGAPPPRWARLVDEDPAANLAFQGISRGDRVAIAEDRRLKGEKPGIGDARAGRVAPAQRLAEVAAGARHAPDLFQTAIELPARLFLSPAQDATWLTPNESVRRRVFGTQADLAETCRELWSATLGGSGQGAGLRAVWSPDFRPEALLSRNAPGAPPWGPYAPWAVSRALGVRSSTEELKDIPKFRTSLDAFDRHELVVLSSVHGLPVLGRRTLNGEIAPGGSQIDPPEGYRLSGLARDAPPKQNGLAQKERDLSAIYMPQVLSVSELALTALGGNLNLDTTFTPPSSIRLDGSRAGLFDAFTIERWRHRTVLGRDVLVEVVYKGFLFPIGHKATLVKVTERRFEQHYANGPPVAVLIQRMFLRIGEPVKLFPAYDHPNGARRWPCERVTMLTRRTPDIVEPIDENGGLIHLDGSPGRIFWPRTARRSGAEVKFQMLMDDEAAPSAMPLVFVDNQAADDSETMQGLVDWYNGDATVPASPPLPMRRLPRGGQPVRMAPERKPGDTTYETRWWDLKAEGRESQEPLAQTPANWIPLAQVKNRNYDRDPFMNGLDQPPFYPLCDAAECRLTSIERFTGGDAAWAVVAYDGYYVAHGFGDEKVRPPETGAAAEKPGEEKPAPGGEVFLRLVSGYDGKQGRPLEMRMRSGDRSGGIGQPNLDIVGISRATGPVGAAVNRRSDNPGDDENDGAKGGDVALGGPVAVNADRLTTIPSVSEYSAPPAADAGDGKKDLVALLEKARKMFPADAKLLGLVPLSQVIRIASRRASDVPALKEVVEYGAAGAHATGAEARALLSDTVLVPVRKAVDEIDRQWSEIARRNVDLPEAGRFSLEEAYPQLGRGLRSLRKAIDDALATASDVAFFAGLATIYEAGRAFVSAIGRILRDPLASISEAQTAQLREFVRKIQDLRRYATLRALHDLPWMRWSAGLDTVVGSMRSDIQLWYRSMLIVPGYVQSLSEQERKDFDRVVKDIGEEILTRAVGKIDIAPGKGVDLDVVLSGIAGDFVTILAEKRASAAGKVKAALAEIEDQIKAEAGNDPQLVFKFLATPRLQSAVGAAREMKEAYGELKSADSPALLLRHLGRILISVDALLGDSRITAALKDACGPVGRQLPSAVGKLATALLPLTGPRSGDWPMSVEQFKNLMEDSPPPATKPPAALEKVGAGDPIALGEVVGTFHHLAYGLWQVEQKVPAGPLRQPLRDARKEVAATGRRLASGLTRLDERMRWAAGLAGATWTCPDLPPEALTGIGGLIKDQRAMVDVVTSAVTQLVKTAGLLRQLIDGMAEDAIAALAQSVTDLLAAEIALLRHLQIATLAAASPSGQRKGALEPFVASMRELGRTLGDPPLLAASVEEIAGKAADLTGLHTAAADYVDRIRGRDPSGDRGSIRAACAALDQAAAQIGPRLETALEKVVEEVEAKATGAVTRLLAGAVAAASTVDAAAAPMIAPVVAAVADAYGTVKVFRDQAVSDLTNVSGVSNPVLRSILAALLGERGLASVLLACEPSGPACTVRTDRLAAEADAFDAASRAPASLVGAMAPLQPVADAWARGRHDPAPVEILRQIVRIDGEFLRTLVLSAIDLKAVRRELESRIRNLVPARVTLPYRLDNELAGFPPSNPIFVPAKNTRLTIESNATIHLLPDGDGPPKAPDFSISGEMGPFGIRLLGQKFDVVTVNFHGLSFKAGSGRSPDFSVRFKDVRTGDKAKFLEPLQEYLSPKGSGFFLKALDDRPGLEAGYGINLGVIGCGVLSFSNVTLNAAVRLPFDRKGEARFLVSIGRSDAPFLISSTIFGGGGYLALIANSRSIVGFEATFDWGGVAAFGFGPLQGVGRLTVGIYLRKEGRQTTIGGTFFAGGSAHICGFGLCASLLVRMKQVNGGPMQGEATFTFSFSIGIDDIEFEVKVSRNQGQTMGQQAFLAPTDGPLLDFAPTRYAAGSFQMNDAEPGYVLAGGPSGRVGSDGSHAAAAGVSGERLSVKGATMESDWHAYRAYFDDGLKPRKGTRKTGGAVPPAKGRKAAKPGRGATR